MGFRHTFSESVPQLSLKQAALRVLIVDREPVDRAALRDAIAAVADVEVVDCVGTVAAAIAAIRRHAPDLVLMEVALPDGNGFEIAAATEIPRPLFGLVSANPRHALRAFDINAVGYLLKPVQGEQVVQLLERACSLHALNGAGARIESLERVVRSLREQALDEIGPGYLADLWVRTRGTNQIRIPIEAIDWVDAQEQYACVHVQGHKHPLRTSLDQLMQQLDPRDFVRIHHSIVVRLDRIVQISRPRAGRSEAILHDQTRLPVGRIYAKRLPWRLRGT